MTRSPAFRVGVLGACVSALAAAPLLAQQAACILRATAPATTTLSPSTGDLPVDRISDLLALTPGVSSLDHGELSIRNAGAGANGLYLDGVPVIPGTRGFQSPALGGSYFGATGIGLAVGTNGFEQLRLTAGLTPLDLGNARGGVVEVETTPCAGEGDDRSVFRAGVASDALFGNANGLGFTRLTANGRGHFGRLVIGGAAVVEGQESTRLGRDQNGAPVYVADGIDTTLTFNDGESDQTVAVQRFARSDGIRISHSANSNYTVSGQIGYFLGARHRLQLSGLASQAQRRVFSYEDLYNSSQTFGTRDWSEVVTASWFGDLKRSERLSLSAEAHLSLQWDHATDAPLSAAGERDSRDPGLGMLIWPLDFRFDGSSFKVDDALIRNFRTNTGRVTPYDLTNADQYSTIDRYRNNAYGVQGFTEGGGPVGRLGIFEEKRVVGKGVVTAELGARHRFRAGFETTSYDVAYYSSQLTSQALADAFVESPSSSALFGEYRLTVPTMTVTAGARYDHFNSGASRPLFPRISSRPDFDPANPTAGFIDDHSHGQVSPRVVIAFEPNSRVRIFGGYTALAQVPDFQAVYAGVNTDLSTTNTSQVYGSDLDFERSTIVEAGGEYLIDSSTTIGASFWHRQDHDLIVTRNSLEFDPFRGTSSDIFRFKNDLEGTTRGLDLRVTRALGTHGQAWLSYSLVSPNDSVKTLSRHHNLALAVMYQTGESNLLGGVLRNTGVYGAVRVASGTRYTECDESFANQSVLSGDRCGSFPLGEFNGATLPAFKVIDLRVTRGFSLGGSEIVAFADARNLLNLQSVTRVFSQTQSIRNDRERESRRAGYLTNFANEAAVNGVLQPDNSIDLTFSGVADPRAACGNWSTVQNPAPPNCVYLLQAEERFGNGDHIFTVAEQTRAIDAYYDTSRGEQNFTAPARRVRLGVEVRF